MLSGDLHTFVAGDLHTNGETSGKPIGVELVGGSATSFGLPEELGVPSSALQALRQASDPHVKFAAHGTVSTIAKFQVDSGKRTLNQL